MKREITLKEILAHLGHGLKSVSYFDGIELIREVAIHNCLGFIDKSTDAKLVLRPLSTIAEPIEHEGEKFNPAERLLGKTPFHFSHAEIMHEKLYIYFTNETGWREIDINKYKVVQKLLEWKFDYFGLIEDNLAIPVTKDFNPYK